MKKIIQNKLIRDKIPEIIKINGEKSKVTKLNEKQFDKALKEKMLEESLEVKNAKTREEILCELADVMEVMKSIAKNNKITFNDIEKTRKEKLAKRGGFQKRLFLKYTYKE